MITKNDCILLLTELEEKGVNTKDALREAISQGATLSVIKFINDNRQLDLTTFYEKIRKNYNKKKSSLYINIVKEIETPNEVLTTLSALLTQILLFARDIENREMFLKHARALEITKILTDYFQTYSLTNCIKLLKVIKADIKALESMK